MYQEILQEMGLSVNEAKVYEALLKLGVTTANNVALEAKIQRRNTYDTLKKLKEKGLCSEIVEEGVRKFSSINPQKILDIMKEKESMFSQVLPRMIEKHKTNEKVEQTIVYKGIESVKSFYWDMIRSGENLLVIGGRGNWLDKRWEFFLPKMEKERIKKGIRYKHLFYYDLKDPKHPNHKITKILKDNKFRFLPKGFTSTCSIEIFGNCTASMYWGEEPFVVVIISDKIAEGYKKYFEFMWNNSIKGNA